MESPEALLVNDLNAMLVVINSTGQVVYLNKAVQNILGYDSAELMGDKWWIKTKFNDAHATTIKQSVLNLKPANGEARYVEHLIKTSSGNAKWVRWNLRLLSDGKIAALGLDITNTKRQEEQLVNSQKQLKKRNEELSDSIVYAARLQRALLPALNGVGKLLNNLFAYFKPKEEVGGDFYFWTLTPNGAALFLADCTGHGVPGAMMTMLSSNIVQRVLQNVSNKTSSQLMHEIDEQLTKALNQNSEDIYDGMDAALVLYNKQTGELDFCGAQQSLWVINNKEVTEIKGSGYPIGLWDLGSKEFVSHIIKVTKGDFVVLSTDGFYDQFGGDRNKKFKRKNFKEMLSVLPLLEDNEHESYLDYSLNSWKQNTEQTDDITVVGFEIP